MDYNNITHQLQDWSNSHNNLESRITISIDRERFQQTRNALTNAFVGLSASIDEAVKAYVNHTNAVLDGVGGATLDVSGLMQPFNPIGQLNQVAHLAQQAMLQNGNMAPQQQNPQLNPDGTRKKRAYKPRDPNAPKRPLTAYFRYLQEQRPLISKELQANGPTEGGKAGDISKIATERWNSLDEKTRRPYRLAYESELGAYNDAVKQYKAATGQDVDATQVEEDGIPPTPAQATAAADDEDEDEEDDSDDDDDNESSEDSESASDSSSEEEPTPPPKKQKNKSPEVPTKTPKSSAKKTAKAGADPVAPVQQFSSLSQPQAPVAAMTQSQSKKRKVEEADASEKKKKRKSKSQAEQEEADAAAAASQLQIDPQLQQMSTEKHKKDKKKKRKSEAGVGA